MGQQLHRIAREQLGVGTSLQRTPEERAVIATAEALNDSNVQIVAEATFVLDSFAARADILRRNRDGWDLIEVKSGMEPEDRVTKKGVKKGVPKVEYLSDLAYTLFVAQGTGLQINQCFLMLMSRQYRHGAPGPILVEVDVTSKAMQLAASCKANSGPIARAVLSPDRPKPELILGCGKCPYFERECLGREIPNPLFFLPRLGEKRFQELKQYLRIDALPDEVELTEPQRRIAAVIKTGEASIKGDGLALLDLVHWPAYYLDFESVAPALPWFEGSRPYDAIPFQFSLHVKPGPDEVARHFEYLAPSKGDWRRELAECLLGTIGTEGSVLMYTGYEKRMLDYLADTLPDLAPALIAIKSRLYDLEVVIDVAYCHPGFQGRTSIKKVLPVMVPDLSYEGLTIRGGEDASGTFALMYLNAMPVERHDAERQALMEYCKLDTLAMVRVHEALMRLRHSFSMSSQPNRPEA